MWLSTEILRATQASECTLRQNKSEAMAPNAAEIMYLALRLNVLHLDDPSSRASLAACLLRASSVPAQRAGVVAAQRAGGEVHDWLMNQFAKPLRACDAAAIAAVMGCSASTVGNHSRVLLQLKGPKGGKELPKGRPGQNRAGPYWSGKSRASISRRLNKLNVISIYIYIILNNLNSQFE